jgi:hypothetical protein
MLRSINVGSRVRPINEDDFPSLTKDSLVRFLCLKEAVTIETLLLMRSFYES